MLCSINTSSVSINAYSVNVVLLYLLLIQFDHFLVILLRTVKKQEFLA